MYLLSFHLGIGRYNCLWLGIAHVGPLTYVSFPCLPTWCLRPLTKFASQSLPLPLFLFDSFCSVFNFLIYIWVYESFYLYYCTYLTLCLSLSSLALHFTSSEANFQVTECQKWLNEKTKKDENYFGQKTTNLSPFKNAISPQSGPNYSLKMSF